MPHTTYIPVPAGLYVHIPFCIRRCGYCAFATYASDNEALWERYVQALCLELFQWPGKINVRTVFFGGGTPSLLPARLLKKITDTIRVNFDVAADAEWTTEAHPSTCLGAEGRAKLSALQACGFNRISFGIESFHPDTLKRLDRRYAYSDIEALIRRCREAGFANINLDLILGWPWEQDDGAMERGSDGARGDIFKRSLELAAGLNPEHLSLYPLSIEEGTPFQSQQVKTDPDRQAEEFLHADKYLTELGWEHYEIANYAKPGFRSRHNLIYWNYEDYLGVGLASSSKIGNKSFQNTRSMEEYLAFAMEGRAPSSPFAGHDRAWPSRGMTEQKNEEILPNEETARRRTIMKLRLKEGVSSAQLEPFRENKTMESFREAGYLLDQNGSSFLTPQGWLLSNQFFSEIL